MSFHIAVEWWIPEKKNPVRHNHCPSAHGGRLTTIPPAPLDKEKWWRVLRIHQLQHFWHLKLSKNCFLAKPSSHCKKWHCISLLMWPSHHQFQMIFLSQSRLFPCIIAFTMILYQLTLKLAWYINSYITFQIGTCPRPPRFDNHDEAWLCLGLAAFITLSWDNIAIMRALAMQWCTYRGSHHSPYSYVYTYSPIPLY